MFDGVRVKLFFGPLRSTIRTNQIFFGGGRGAILCLIWLHKIIELCCERKMSVTILNSNTFFMLDYIDSLQRDKPTKKVDTFIYVDAVYI